MAIWEIGKDYIRVAMVQKNKQRCSSKGFYLIDNYVWKKGVAGLSFASGRKHHCLMCSSLVELRSEVMKSLMSRGVFGTLGNRPAAALDYMPALRTICRSEQLKEQGKIKRRYSSWCLVCCCHQVLVWPEGGMCFCCSLKASTPFFDTKLVRIMEVIRKCLLAVS